MSISRFLIVMIITLASADTGAEGIIVSLKSSARAKEFDLYAEELGLQKKFESLNLRVVSYHSKIKGKKIICELVKNHSAVEFCELNEKTKTHQELCHPDPSENLAVLEDVITNIMPQVCELLPRSPRYPTLRSDLSPFWAQEYTGSDLVRKELEVSRPWPGDRENNVLILDIVAPSYPHGTLVSNLISSPHSSATIPGPLNPVRIARYNEDYIEQHTQITQLSPAPRYINNSMYWSGSYIVQRVFRDFAANGIVSVVAAGNSGVEDPVDPVKTEMADHLVIVGSTDPLGIVSTFSQFSTEVVVTAPSNLEVLSHDGEKFINFSGTSGATPQVTAALAAFSLISGHTLTVDQAKNLLRNTAIKLPHSYSTPQVHGVGSLNTYQVTAIAKRAYHECGSQNDSSQRTECFNRFLQQRETYSETISDISSVQETFPECFSRRSTGIPISCDIRRLELERLRKAAFLNPSNHLLWSAIACIHHSDGLHQNAKFYELLSMSTTKERFTESVRSK